jgi:hypothetical protein
MDDHARQDGTGIKRTMKVVGGRNLPPFWDRFDRLQRTADLLLPREAHPLKGTFVFKTHEDYEEWKKAQQLAFLKKATS